MTIKYLAGNRIQGTSKDATYRENFHANNWVLGGGADRQVVNTNTHKLEYDGSRDGNDGITGLIRNVAQSDTAWTLRFCLTPTTLTWSSVAEPVFIVLSNSDEDSVGSASQDAIGIVIKIDSSHQTGQIRTCWGNNEAISANESDLVPDLIDIKGIWYVDITRTAAATFTVSVYRNLDYTNLVATKDVTMDGTLPTDLKWLKVCNYDGYGADSTVNTGTISNIVFTNGGYPPVQVPTGSVYEETDTRKSYVKTSATEWIEIT